MSTISESFDSLEYAVGTRDDYNATYPHDPNTLYWCEDTRELFKGDSQYTEGVRFISDAQALSTAAQGVLYMQDDGNGFVFNGSAWKKVVYAVTQTVNELSTVNEIPSAKAVYDALQKIDVEKIGENLFANKNDFEKIKQTVALTCTWREL